MSMPDAARFCGACGRSLSIQNPTVPTRFVKTNLRFIPNALQGAVPALGCFAFGVSVLEIVLSVAEEETPVSGALIPLVYYGCWTGLFAALWDGLRRLANLTQGYMHAHLNHTFKTLQFYNQIKT